MTDQHLRIRLEPKRTAQLEALCGFVICEGTRIFVAERCVFHIHMPCAVTDTSPHHHQHDEHLIPRWSIYKDAEDAEEIRKQRTLCVPPRSLWFEQLLVARPDRGADLQRL